jgi:hypothetical protein
MTFQLMHYATIFVVSRSLVESECACWQGSICSLVPRQTYNEDKRRYSRRLRSRTKVEDSRYGSRTGGVWRRA